MIGIQPVGGRFPPGVGFRVPVVFAVVAVDPAPGWVVEVDPHQVDGAAPEAPDRAVAVVFPVPVAVGALLFAAADPAVVGPLPGDGGGLVMVVDPDAGEVFPVAVCTRPPIDPEPVEVVAPLTVEVLLLGLIGVERPAVPDDGEVFFVSVAVRPP